MSEFHYSPQEIADRLKHTRTSFELRFGKKMNPIAALSMAASSDLDKDAIDDSFWPSRASLGRYMDVGRAIGRVGNAALGVVDTLQKPVANFAIDVLTEPGRRAEEQRQLIDKAYDDNAPGWKSAMRAAGPKAMLTEEQIARLTPGEQQRLKEIEESNMLDYMGMGSVENVAGKAAKAAAPAITSRAKHYVESLQSKIKDIEASPAYKEDLLGRGGGKVIANAETYTKAIELGPLDEAALTNWKAETPVNTVDVVRAKETMNSVANEVLDAWKIGDEVLARELEGKATQMEAGYQMMTATPGRALQVQGTFVDKAVAVQKEISELFKSNKGPLTDSQKRFIQEKIKELLARADKVPDKEVAFSWIKAVEEYATAAKLTSPLTHAVNTVSNALTGVQRIGEKTLAATFGGQPGAAKYAFGSKAGWSSGFQKFIGVLQDENMATQAKEFGTARQIIPGKLGKVIRFPFRMLAAADDFSKAVLSDSEIHMQAYEQAAKEGLKGKALASRITEIVQDPPESFIAKAKTAAKEYTFQEDPSGFVKGMITAIDKLPGGRLIVPFIQTPTNIVKFYGRRSPFGLVAPKNWSDLRAGGTAQKEAAGRLSLGLGLSVGAWQWVQGLKTEERITGMTPVDKGERDIFYAQGKRPYSIKMGDKWVSYQRFQPVGLYLLMAKALDDALENQDADNAGEIISAMTVVAAKGVSEMPFVSGVSNVLEAINDPERSGSRVFRRTLSGFIPTGMRDIARIMDSVQRNPQNLAEELKSGIPGLSKEVTPRVNTLGQEQEGEPNSLVRGLVKIVSTERPNKTLKEMESVGFLPDPPAKIQRNVELSPDEYTDFAKLSGQGFEKSAKKIMSSDEYKEATDERKQQILRNSLESARENTRNEIFSRRVPLISTLTTEAKEWDDDLKDASSSDKLKARPIWREAVRPSIAEMTEQPDKEAAEGWRLFLEEWDERNEDIGDLVSPNSDKFPKDIWDREINDILRDFPAFAEQYQVVPKNLVLR